MYRIVPFGNTWWVVYVVGDKNVLMHKALTHEEALEVRRELMNAPPVDTYDNYIEM